MSIKYNVNEVFKMAEKMEENAGNFYRDAAERQEDQDCKELLTSLAEMEVGHRETFASMRKEFASDLESAGIDPNGEAEMYLAGIAEGQGAEGSINLDNIFTGDENPKEILQKALLLEKNAILFFIGIKSMVPEGLGRDKVELIIEEEKKHISSIASQIFKLENQ